MSIYEAGGIACGLCSVANRQLFIKSLKEHPQGAQVFILMLDNDEAGKQGQAELEKGLQGLGVAYVSADYPAGIKDPNQYLQEDPEGLKAAVSSLQAQALEAAAAVKGNEYNALDLLDYFKTIEQQPAGFEAKTGFTELDRELCGGLHEGLYIIGAISSLGKTTFTLQIADQIAAGGQDVIFFSLEMSKYELIAKSISRHTYQIKREAKTKDGQRFLARDTQQILNNRRYTSYDAEEKQTIKEAIAAYEKEAPHIFIYEGRYKGERLTVAHIREIVKQHIKTTGQKPVVFVDYLQIIAPADPHATDKQNTDTNTFELKEISRDYGIPVFAVSSFNRDNYNEPVSMQSFKESGAIEYSSDVLFGLQYTGMDYQEGESATSRNKRLRELITDIYRKKRNRELITVDLKCLKQRNGYQFTQSFYMMPAYNHFESILGKAGLDEWRKAQEEKTRKKM
jgi:replicative DNA helicase